MQQILETILGELTNSSTGSSPGAGRSSLSGLAGLAKQFGLSEDALPGAMSKLIPGLAGGLLGNIAGSGGLESLLKALKDGGHSRYLENPGAVGSADAISDGNSILGHILGSKDRSREVAGEAAAATGIGGAVMKRLLPVVATLVMGALSKKFVSGMSGIAGGPAAASAPSSGFDLQSTLSELSNPGGGSSQAGSFADMLSSFLK